MGGYAAYVWTSYGIAAVVLIANLVIPVQKHRLVAGAAATAHPAGAESAMTPARKQRLILIAIMVVGVAIAIGFALKAFQENLMFFFSPTEVAEGKPPTNAPFRLGGMVVAGSVRRPEGVKVLFDLSDYHKSVTVQYEGILPDLFREGQGMVALGRLGPDGVFIADEVLAKHDENYMPPEVNDAVMKGQALQKARGQEIGRKNR